MRLPDRAMRMKEGLVAVISSPHPPKRSFQCFNQNICYNFPLTFINIKIIFFAKTYFSIYFQRSSSNYKDFFKMMVLKEPRKYFPLNIYNCIFFQKNERLGTDFRFQTALAI